MSTIRKYWRSQKKHKSYPVVPPVVCVDGFTMSVQASRGHYCLPRETDLKGNYRAWEVGFPSKKETTLLPYAENKKTPTDTVYSCVPTEVVDALIEKHGGLAA